MQHTKSKLPEVSTTIFTIMSSLAAKHNAINLSQGFPNFETNKKLIDLVTIGMQKGYNQYAPMAGLLSLREAISEKTNILHNKYYHPETEITITSGATQAIFTIISAFINSGDEVIIFKPAYDSYEPSVQLFDGTIIPIQLSAPNFTIDWQEVAAKISSKSTLR